jgi:hypothetical protein
MISVQRCQTRSLMINVSYILRHLTFLLAVSACVQCADAKPITQAEKRYCADAYHRYCGNYGLESNALRNCMSRNGRSLPHGCIEALINAGEVSRDEVERRRKSGK